MENLYLKYNIDKNKLSRDYENNPLKYIPLKTGGYKKEIPNKKDLEYLYLNLNLSTSVIGEFFEVNRALVTKWNKCYDLHKNIKDVSKCSQETNKRLYGCSHYTNREKSKQTCLKKYGVDNFVECNKFKEKSKQTCLKKYGVDNYAKTDEYKTKTNDTNLKKYGSKWFLQSNDYLKLLKKEYECKNGYQTIHSKDVYHILNNKNRLLDYIKNNDIINGYHLADSLNISRTMANYYLRIYDLHKIFKYHRSVLELEIMKYVSSLIDIIQNDRTIIKPLELDIYVPSKNVAIEINGDYWHDYTIFPDVYERDKKKKQLCEEKGINLFIIWEHDWKENSDKIKKQILDIIQ